MDPDPDSAVRGFVRICNFKYHRPFRTTFTTSTWFLQKFKFGEVLEYIDNTENYVNIQLERNELIQLQPMGIFGYVVGGYTTFCFFIFLLLGYRRWKKLLGSQS